MQVGPRGQLADDERNRKCATNSNAAPDRLQFTAFRAIPGPLEKDTAHHEDAGVDPQQRGFRQRAPVGIFHPDGIGADEQREQGSRYGEKNTEPEFHVGQRLGRERRSHTFVAHAVRSSIRDPRCDVDRLFHQPPDDCAHQQGKENQRNAQLSSFRANSD